MLCALDCSKTYFKIKKSYGRSFEHFEVKLDPTLGNISAPLRKSDEIRPRSGFCFVAFATKLIFGHGLVTGYRLVACLWQVFVFSIFFPEKNSKNFCKKN